MRVILVSIFLIISNLAVAQVLKKNAISIEGLGHSINGYSINYDRIIHSTYKYWVSNNTGISYRTNQYEPQKNWSIFNTVNIVLGQKNGRLEFGAGLGVIKNKSYGKGTMTRGLLLGRFGYRYQRPLGGFFMRAAFTPNAMLYDNPECIGWCDLDLIVHFIGVSLGYSF